MWKTQPSSFRVHTLSFPTSLARSSTELPQGPAKRGKDPAQETALVPTIQSLKHLGFYLFFFFNNLKN